jgi:hypothetical protein
MMQQTFRHVMRCGLFQVRYYQTIASAALAALMLSTVETRAQTIAPEHPKDRGASVRRKNVTMEELAAALASQRSDSKLDVRQTPALPPLPEGVTELRFNEFYKMPVGPRGLEPTEKLLSLRGKRVRLLGHMANMRLRNNRQMIFAPVPLKAQPMEYGQADDIPAAHVLVRVPGSTAEPVPYTPGLLLLTGTLSVGGRSFDGENAFVRLLLDLPETKPDSSVTSDAVKR